MQFRRCASSGYRRSSRRLWRPMAFAALVAVVSGIAFSSAALAQAKKPDAENGKAGAPSKFGEDLVADEPIGKRLGFLLQEMNREANTIGSKANDTEIAHLSVTLKEDIEKIREQIQNIE